MDKELPKIIGYMVLAFMAYMILSAIMPYLLWGIVALIIYYLYLQANQHHHGK